MALSTRIAETLNTLLPGGWRLYHPTALPAENPTPAPVQVSEAPPPAAPIVEPPAPPPPAPVAAPRLYAPLGPDIAMTLLHDGHLIYVDPNDEQIAPHLIATGVWERAVEQTVRHLVRPGDRVIEVGANMGYYTLIMAAEMGPEGRLDAFEANPRMTRLLSRSLHANGYLERVTLHQKAVSDRSGTLTFATSAREGGGGTILENGRDFGEETLAYEVESISLDEFMPAGTVDVIRTDAEGAEALILPGAMQLLARSPTVKLCVEWSVFMMHRRGDVDAIVRQLVDLGFQFWRIDPSDGSLIPTPSSEMTGLPHCDVIIARSLD